MTTATVERVSIDPELARRLARIANRMEADKLQRDQLIYEAWQQGAGYREIARVVGLTHPAVMNIVTKMSLEQKEITMRRGQQLGPLDPGGGD